MEDCCGALRPCDTFAPRSLQRGRAARQGDAPRKRGRALPPAVVETPKLAVQIALRMQTAAMHSSMQS